MAVDTLDSRYCVESNTDWMNLTGPIHEYAQMEVEEEVEGRKVVRPLWRKVKEPVPADVPPYVSQVGGSNPAGEGGSET